MEQSPLAARPPARRRAGRWRRSRRGVAAVIGALLVMVMVVSVFGIFLTEAVPVWMEENESAWASAAEASMASLKADVDLQYSLGSVPSYSVGFPLESSGVPLLAAPTQGDLQFVPGGGTYTNLSGGFAADGSPFAQNVSSGTLTMTLPNRYAAPESLVFQGDGVIRVPNGANATFDFAPGFSVTSAGGNTTLSIVLISVQGAASAISAPGTGSVSTTLGSRTTLGLHGPRGSNGTDEPFAVSLRIGSTYACAWEGFLAQALANVGLGPGSFELRGPVGGCAGTVTLGISAIDWCTVYLVSTYLGIGPGAG